MSATASTLCAGVARRRVAVLVAAAVVAVVLEVFGNGPARGLVPIALLLLAVVAVRVFHPAELVARPASAAFVVPANPGMVLAAAGYTILGGRVVGDLIREPATGEAVFVIVSVGLLVALWLVALGDFGVRLRPDGIVHRRILGSLVVPWAAVATPVAARAVSTQQIALLVDRPDLARGRGLRRGSPTLLPATAVDARFLAAAINEYAGQPGRRASIGTAAELARLLSGPSSPPAR